MTTESNGPVRTGVTLDEGKSVVTLPPAGRKEAVGDDSAYLAEEPSGGAIGWITFAGIMMIIGGGFGILQGLAWVINSDRFPGTDSLTSQDVTTWGWITLVVGAIVLLAGFGVFTGNILARIVGVIAACLSALSAFVAMSFYPIWGICIVAIDVAVIWALTAHGRDLRKAMEM
ncbi:MAG TPA: hypothetical protein VLX89_00955 [Actinomycetota bacterium]|nr:hypothetical protein [Actinomycetota bacterium]